MLLDKRFKNFDEYLTVTHGGAREIKWRELASDFDYIGSLVEGTIVRHVFWTKYCGKWQYVEVVDKEVKNNEKI